MEVPFQVCSFLFQSAAAANRITNLQLRTTWDLADVADVADVDTVEGTAGAKSYTSGPESPSNRLEAGHIKSQNLHIQPDR